MSRRSVPLERLASVPASTQGLSAQQVERQRNFGYNDIVAPASGGWLVVARDTARDPMLWFLLLTAGLFGLLGQVTESLTLLLAMAPLLGMDAYLHRRTSASSAGLASRLASSAKVLRDGQWRSVPSRELVPGDLAEVTPGDYFPADGLLVAGTGLQADESTLTGESLPVAKRALDAAAPLPASVPEEHWGTAGTRLLTGTARLRIVFIGGETRYGEIVRSATEGSHAATPLQKAIGELVAVLLGVAVVMCVVLAGDQAVAWPRLDRCPAQRADAGRGRAARGVPGRLHLLPRRRRVPSGAPQGPGAARGGGGEHRPRHLHRVRQDRNDHRRRAGAGASGTGRRARRGRAAAGGHVRLAAGQRRPARPGPAGRSGRVAANDEAGRLPVHGSAAPRDGRPRRDGDGAVAYTKGAPETVLATCKLAADERAGWLAHVEAYARSGHKVIGCARRAMLADGHRAASPGRFQFVGLLAFEDPVRDGVREAIADCMAAGMRVIMVTGDHPATAAAIAREIGLGGNSRASVVLAPDDDAGAALRAAVVCTWWRAPRRRRSSTWCRRCRRRGSWSPSPATASTTCRRCGWPTSA